MPLRTANDDRRSRSGFTLVELLVVIAIIGALVALLLPAVQAARDTARRTQCASQIKQLALAALEYEGVHKLLPAAGFAKLKSEPPAVSDEIIYNPYAGIQFSWIVTLLPHLEQAALARQFDPARQIFQQAGNPQATRLPLLICPSDGSQPSLLTHAGLTLGREFAKGNYAAYTSPFHIDLQLMYPGALIAGGQDLAAIEDGTTHTIVMAEIRTHESPSDSRGAWALPWPGATLLSFDMHPHGWGANHDGTGAGDGYHAQIRSPYEASSESLGESMRPNNQGPNADTIKLCQGELQRAAADARMPCTLDLPPGTHGYMTAAPRSQHPGGVNGAYLDGHVQFLPDDIDEFVMAYSVSVNDGMINQ
ncbi:DUF1559 family PulG-like putative transporter [Lacipirellula limnantheis]|uniref:Type II secretion system protein G n=1 Tax=Lacipirellula limnantheis TaxID=2528024 RepID=A0A517TTF2_9BACT|nr:DUF1559 domain-containing protein [Lacipirellula limnantheis]QDT71657.1 Type II secretion system protein G precursor [Lacipirellula limnantheis]